MSVESVYGSEPRQNGSIGTVEVGGAYVEELEMQMLQKVATYLQGWAC